MKIHFISHYNFRNISATNSVVPGESTHIVEAESKKEQTKFFGVHFASNIKNLGLPSKNYNLDGKRILVTGGTGTLGQALISELLKNYSPKEIVVYSRDEYKQYKMKHDLPTTAPVRFVIGNVRDKKALYDATKNIDVIIHTAAMKHVPICEENPDEAFKTNVNGALNVINAALANNVKRVISISTDKAAAPGNLYGETKLLSERLFVNANKFASDEQHFCNIRMGNILGSRGSVLPLFERQKKDGELTVTDENMTRFFITPTAAAKQVLSSIEIMRGGEIFIPKLKSIDILTLAKQVAPDAKIRVTGLRAGEKMHEVLITDAEQNKMYEFLDRYVILPSNLHVPEAQKVLGADNYYSDNPELRFTQEELDEIITKYRSSC